MLIADQDTLIPSDVEGFVIIRRPQDLTEAVDILSTRIAEWLDNNATPVQVNYNDGGEPERLIAAKEYRAALISAIAMLEDRLNRYLPGADQYESFRRPSLTQLVRQAVNREGISAADADTLFASIKMRNAALHQNAPVTERQAVEAVHVIRDIIQRLDNLL